MAQERLYQCYFEDAYRTCNRYLSQHADVLAVINDGFFKVFQKLDTYDATLGSLGGWIHRIMMRCAIDHLRRENRLGLVTLPCETHAEALSVSNEAFADLAVEELLMLVKGLPVTTRLVFNMSVMEGYSHREIAQELGMTESTSRWHLAEARKQLQELITRKEKMVSA
jgi:RNA polymerase sigma-70 factor (ECF subfamily)